MSDLAAVIGRIAEEHRVNVLKYGEGYDWPPGSEARAEPTVFVEGYGAACPLAWLERAREEMNQQRGTDGGG